MPKPTLALFALALALGPLATVQADPPFVVLRIVRGDVLEYRIVPEADHEALKAEIRAESEKHPPRVDKVSGRFDTQEEAVHAWHEDAEKNACFTCWRCEGAGELEIPGPKPKKERCPACGGRGRCQSTGYAIVRYEYYSGWTYLFLRAGPMHAYVEEQVKKSAQMQSQGVGGSSIPAPKMESVQLFRAGDYDEARAYLERLREEAADRKGFSDSSAVPGIIVPAVDWPSELFAR